jgi:hypothetical protein
MTINFKISSSAAPYGTAGLAIATAMINSMPDGEQRRLLDRAKILLSGHGASHCTVAVDIIDDLLAQLKP